MAKFRVVRSLIVNGKPVHAGTEIEISDAELDHLLAAGQIVKAEAEAEPKKSRKSKAGATQPDPAAPDLEQVS